MTPINRNTPTTRRHILPKTGNTFPGASNGGGTAPPPEGPRPEGERAAIIALAKIEMARRLGRSARVPADALADLAAVLGPLLDAAYAWGISTTGDGVPLPDLAALLRACADAIEAERTALPVSPGERP